ncbi:MAG: hypothetical protein KKD77_23605 [Gammaproteobacteria bacterium]|nr:hypothetical protein [Gammaproteobacteria bacterium]
MNEYEFNNLKVGDIIHDIEKDIYYTVVEIGKDNTTVMSTIYLNINSDLKNYMVI